MTDELPRRLRSALLGAGFTHDSVVELLGPVAHAALGRNETTPALRRTTGGGPIETLVRLFLLQTRVPLKAAEAALPGLVDDLVGHRLLDREVDEVSALVDCRPYAADDRDLWVVSDLTPGLDGAPIRVDPGHVLGISPASTSLAQLTLRHPVGSSLDLGTGCGVQALHLAGHSDRVVATDVNPRALWMTRLNLALNEVDGVDVREGSLLGPVAGERFDLIATNPPFVIGPADGDPVETLAPQEPLLVYRDSGLPGDQVVETIVRDAPGHLAEGGWLQLLGNWAVLRDRPWDERVAGWVADDCCALVVQREVLDPAAYVELWLKDSGHHGAVDYPARYDGWLAWFDEQRIEGVGFGWINLRRSPGRTTCLDWPYDVEQPVAPAIAAWGDAVEALTGLEDDDLLADRLVLAPDVRQETHGRPGEADPETIVLRQQRGLRRARSADTVVAGLVGAADGDLTTGQLLAALATLLDRSADDLVGEYLPVVRELVAEGFLTIQGR